MPAGGGASEPYLADLAPDQQALLRRVNETALGCLRERLDAGDAVAFLGAGASVPLYPLWGELIGEIVDLAADQLRTESIDTYRSMAASAPDAVLEIVRRELGPATYREVLRKLFRPRRDPVTGWTWTPTHELVVRSNFAGIVTTNYDPGVVNARMAVRRNALSTGFASWTDDDALDRWRTGDVFGDDELPILYAHGHHGKPEAIVLASTEYRRAYAGKLAKVLARIVDGGHLVWIGFSFADQRIAAILREIGEQSGTQLDPGASPRHVAIMPWDPGAQSGTDGAGAHDPAALRSLIEIQFGAHAAFYPAPNGDHSALAALLATFIDPALPAPAEALAAGDGTPSRAQLRSGAGAGTTAVIEWVHGGLPVPNFTGRVAELASLDRWADDEEVRLVGVTAWGGAGKTALVTQWLTQAAGAARRSAIRGVFAWSCYEDRSIEHWATELLAWAEEQFGVTTGDGSLSARVLRLMREVPLLLVLDGLEVIQDGPAAMEFGRLLDGTLRTLLIGLCQIDHAGLVVLTSRFPFADVEQFDGGAARMLDVPPLTVAEGASLLEAAGGGWLPEADRRSLTAAVDGHALALGVVGGILVERPAADDVASLLTQLETAGRTDERVGRVLEYYAERIGPRDRRLVSLVSLFQRPVSTTTVLALDDDSAAGGAGLAGWNAADVESAVRQRLSGLLSWHPDATISAHPLVRDTFRPLALTGSAANTATTLSLADLPDGVVGTREDGLRVVEMIELLLDAGEWEAAHELFKARTDTGECWKHLPAARLGQRCGLAFIADAERRAECERHLSDDRVAYFLNEVGLFARHAGDVATAEHFLQAAAAYDRDVLNLPDPIVFQNLAACYAVTGRADRSREAADQALAITSSEEIDSLAWAHVLRAAALDLAGETPAAERAFVEGGTLWELLPYGPIGARLWGEFLCRTGRVGVARRHAAESFREADNHGWAAERAGADHVLARCDIADGDLDTAHERLERAATIFRDGDRLADYGAILPTLADQRRLAGDFAEAVRLSREAIALAGPRSLVSVHAGALVVRARVRGERFATSGDREQLDRARDDADLVLRLTTRTRRLPWWELEALDVHADLDAREGADRGWSRRAAELRATLVPDDLDPDPVATAKAAALMHEQAGED